MNHVPGGGNSEIQMRIVRQDRLPRRGALPGHRPRVRTRLRINACSRRKQKVDHRRISALEHVHFRDFFAPARRQRAEHLQSGENRILRAPGPRIVVQQRELQRQSSAMGFQIIIHPSRVCGQHGAIGFGHRALRVVRDLGEPQAPRFLIRFERGLPHHLRQFTRRQPPQRVHLPHAILRCREALQKNYVLPGRSFDMRNPDGVARDGGSRGNRRGDLARCFRQRTPREPINRHQKSDQQNGYAQIDRPQQWRRE